MKKKLFLTLLIVSVFVCVFAISISAVTYTYKDENGNVLFSFDYETTATNYGGTPNAFIASNKQGNGFDKVDAQGNELTWYITNSQTDDAGNKTFTVASLKTVGEAGTINENGVYNFTSPVTNKNTVSVNFPDNAGIKTWGFKSFGGYNSYFNNNILFVYCPNTLTAFENNPFQETPVMVVELEFETPINNIPQNFAHEARNLTSINIPASVAIINGNGPNNGTPFYRNFSLASVNFAPNSVLTTIKQNAFTDCNSLTSLVLPNSVTTIAERAFSACRNLTTIKLGASLKETTGWSVFHTCNSLTVYYIPKTLKTVAQHTFTHDGTAGPSYGVFFYDGTKEELDALVEIAVASKNNNRLTNQYNPDNTTNILEWDPSKPDSYYINMATEQNKKFYIYNYNTCQAFYNGIHDVESEDGNTCSGICENCGNIELIQNPIHTYEWIFNGGKDISYTVAFKAENKCKFCATANQDEEIVEIGAILYSNGISIDETDFTGIYEQIKVDTTALEAYSALSEKAFDYGIFALVAGESQTSAPITKGQDGKATADDKTVYASFTGTEYTYLRIKITGLSNGSSIFCGAYLIIGDNVIYVSNKQEGKEVNKYTMVTEQA